MGLGQFMPGSFHKYAVDFDGNGHRNLWDVEDAIGSVANYFASHGWRRGEPVAIPARASSTVSTKAGFDTRYTLASLQADGIAPVGAVTTPGEVSLLRLDVGTGYDYWIGFTTSTSSHANHSANYAMAVFQLGQAIKPDAVRPSTAAGAMPHRPATGSAPLTPTASMRTVGPVREKQYPVPRREPRDGRAGRTSGAGEVHLVVTSVRTGSAQAGQGDGVRQPDNPAGSGVVWPRLMLDLDLVVGDQQVFPQ
jgi:membrane-bound lytic murein transglycosylase B